MAESGEQMTIIAGDTEIKGEMRFEKSARILGKFEGNIGAKGELHVADGSLCKADIEAGSVLVDGTIEGNVTATEKVQLNAKAKVKGDIQAARLVTAEGASIVGHITVGADAAKGGGAGSGGGGGTGSGGAAKPGATPGKAAESSGKS